MFKSMAVETYKSGKLDEIIEKFEKKIEKCDLCPKKCKINRKIGKGFCNQGYEPRLSNTVLHFGEEPPLVGNGGAGALFFSGCTMSCVYCQNFGFSQLNRGKDLNWKELGKVFIKIQEEGAETLDLVTVTPNTLGFLKALKYALERGFDLPIIHNTSGYENVETLTLLEGIIDIYLTDIRYTSDEIGQKYSGAPDYWTVTKKAVREMFRQVGAFKEFDGIKRGLIVRHLVLPNNISGTEEMAEFISFELSMSVPVSLMSQYRPVFNAKEYPEINRRVNKEEYQKALDILEANGLSGWSQLFDAVEEFRVKPLGGSL